MVLKTRETLIEVARQLFDRKGVAKTTINDIASASDKGRRTVYTYFRNKNEIYNAVLESESEKLVGALRAIIAADSPVTERLTDFLLFRLNHTNILTASPLKKWLIIDRGRVERINDMVHRKEREMLKALIGEGVQAGIFRADRCELLLVFIDQCINRLDVPRADAAPPERDRYIHAFVDFLVTDIMAHR